MRYAHITDDADRNAAGALERRFHAAIRVPYGHVTGTDGRWQGPLEAEAQVVSATGAEDDGSTDDAAVSGSTPRSPTGGIEDGHRGARLCYSWAANRLFSGPRAKERR